MLIYKLLIVQLFFIYYILNSSSLPYIALSLYLLYILNVEYIIIYILSIISIITIYNNLIGLFVSLELFNIMIYIYLFQSQSKINNLNIIRYYLISSITSISFLLALLIIYIDTGNIYLPNNSILGISIIIISILIKSGIGPFYIWKVSLWDQLDPIRFLFVISLPLFLSLYLLSNLLLSIPHTYILYIYIVISIIVISIGYFLYNNLFLLLLYSSIYNSALIYFNILIALYYPLYSIYLYLLVYIVNSIGIIYLFNHIYSKGLNLIKLFLLFLFIMSYIGIPPFGGFYTKLYMFYASLYINNLLFSLLFLLIFISSIFVVPIYLRILYYFSNLNLLSLPSSLPLPISPISLSSLLLLFSPLLYPYLPLF